MKYWCSAVALMFGLAASAFSATKGPEIALVDNKLSINAETIPLGQLLRLLDLATGMQSKVPPDLANRNISVKFSGLSIEDGVRKVFQGQPLDYVMIEGQGIIVTAASQTGDAPERVPTYNNPPAGQQPFQPQPIEQPFNPPVPAAGAPRSGIPSQAGQPQQPGQQPAMIQTPFGPIANPRAGQPVQPASPVPAPPQDNLFPGTAPSQTSSGIVGAQQAAPSPFGTPNPFGTPQSSPSNSNLFGSPTNVFGSQPTQ